VVVLSHVFYHNINIITAVKFIKVRGPYPFCVRIRGYTCFGKQTKGKISAAGFREKILKGEDKKWEISEEK
jgi:hypothetical protein